ncbi:hypothetical protein NDU88_002603 [Pleurodeles waltl]|uniref:Uncharacterized protein n=1 Tax=Pleurodeles waltl TaxID=8319 RepID=A0AAV7RCG9_PLEWA|nr:hypothetical protein NDU88_002603 [Pleurodeles waltl]
MEASLPPSPAKPDQEEASTEDREQGLPASLEMGENKLSQGREPGPVNQQASEVSAPKTHQEHNQPSAAAGNPAPKTTRPKLDPNANAKVNALLKASREEAQQRPEPTRSSTPKGPASKGQKTPGPSPVERQATTDPTLEPPTVVDTATPPEATATVGTLNPEETPEEEAPKDPLPPEFQRESELMPLTETKEGEETKASAKDPAKAKGMKKGKQPKKREDSSGDEEEIGEARNQVRSQRL